MYNLRASDNKRALMGILTEYKSLLVAKTLSGIFSDGKLLAFASFHSL